MQEPHLPHGIIPYAAASFWLLTLRLKFGRIIAKRCAENLSYKIDSSWQSVHKKKTVAIFMHAICIHMHVFEHIYWCSAKAAWYSTRQESHQLYCHLSHCKRGQSNSVLLPASVVHSNENNNSINYDNNIHSLFYVEKKSASIWYFQMGYFAMIASSTSGSGTRRTSVALKQQQHDQHSTSLHEQQTALGNREQLTNQLHDPQINQTINCLPLNWCFFHLHPLSLSLTCSPIILTLSCQFQFTNANVLFVSLSLRPVNINLMWKCTIDTIRYAMFVLIRIILGIGFGETKRWRGERQTEKWNMNKWEVGETERATIIINWKKNWLMKLFNHIDSPSHKLCTIDWKLITMEIAVVLVVEQR